MPKAFTVLDLLDLDLKEHNDLELSCLAARKGLAQKITQPEFNRPGLALSGFFEDFAQQRIQLFGMGETSYLKKLEKENNWINIETILERGIPCSVFTHNNKPPEKFVELSEKYHCPILVTPLTSALFSVRLIRALSDVFAPLKITHGVLVEVTGSGVLLIGESGVGKSETALELVERGHRLVCDDAVEIRCVSGNTLMGKGINSQFSHHLEVRGLGIINVAQLFGIGAIKLQKEIELVIDLEVWNSNFEYDRLGTQNHTTEILGVSLPYVKIPVKPGRNMAILIETAARNERLKRMGIHSAQEFNENVIQWLESENARNVYLRKSNSSIKENSHDT